MKVEDSLWFCRVEAPLSVTGYCETMVKQSDLEDHLKRQHRIRPTDPLDLIKHFTLARGSHHGKPPGRGKVDDQTYKMFDKGDFR